MLTRSDKNQMDDGDSEHDAGRDLSTEIVPSLGDFVTNGIARDLTIKPADEFFLRQCFEDIAGEGEYGKFMGAPASAVDPPHGSNRRILAAFINDEKPSRREIAEYFFKLYAHQAAGDRANQENLNWRLAILLAILVTVSVSFWEFLKGVQAEGFLKMSGTTFVSLMLWILWLIIGFTMLFQYRIRKWLSRQIHPGK